MWIEISYHARKISEFEKAIQLVLEDKTGRERFIWIPKSCYNEITRGNFEIQQIKKWFVSQKKIWELV